MRISDWSSDVCSSDLIETPVAAPVTETTEKAEEQPPLEAGKSIFNYPRSDTTSPRSIPSVPVGGELQSTSDGDDSSTKGNNVPEPKSDGNDNSDNGSPTLPADLGRSEEHTSELQSLMRISYAVLC